MWYSKLPTGNTKQLPWTVTVESCWHSIFQNKYNCFWTPLSQYIYCCLHYSLHCTKYPFQNSSCGWSFFFTQNVMLILFIIIGQFFVRDDVSKPSHKSKGVWHDDGWIVLYSLYTASLIVKPTIVYFGYISYMQNFETCWFCLMKLIQPTSVFALGEFEWST